MFALIAERFERQHAPRWTAVVFSWLARYEGIHHCYFPEDGLSPAAEVLQCLTALPSSSTDEDIAEALSNLEFLSWRVRHPVTQKRWDPFASTFQEFMGDTSPDCWQWEGAYPSTPAIAEWLLGQLPSR